MMDRNDFYHWIEEIEKDAPEGYKIDIVSMIKCAFHNGRISEHVFYQLLEELE